MKIRINRWVYFALGTVASSGPIAVVFAQLFYPGTGIELDDAILSTFGFQSLAVLTYPAGVLGILISLPPIYSGYVTPTEALLIAGPIAIAAGYLQWFVVIPRIWAEHPNPPRRV